MADFNLELPTAGETILSAQDRILIATWIAQAQDLEAIADDIVRGGWPTRTLERAATYRRHAQEFKDGKPLT